MFNLKIPYVIYPLILGLMCGWLVSSIISAQSVSPKPLPTIKTKAEPLKANIMETATSIINQNIFNLSLAPISAASINADGQSVSPDGTINTVTPFNGKLIGIIQNSKNKSGIAIINADGATISIKTGMEKEGMKLIAVDNITAIIEKNNRKYNVILEGGDTQAIRPQQNTPSTNIPTQETGTNLNIAVKKEDIKNELKDLNKVLQSALMTPHIDAEGTMHGYRLVRMKDDSPLKKLGLAQGDIITRINGSELKTPELLFSMMTQIDDTSAVSVDLIRNNDKKTLFVELQ